MAKKLNQVIGSVDLSFAWNNTSSVTIQNLGFTQELNRDYARLLAEYAEPYVPFKSGKLNDSVRITVYGNTTSLTYMPVDEYGRSYSKYQYNRDEGNPEGKDVGAVRTRNVHPLATSKWVHWAWSVWQSQITRDLNEVRKRYRRFNSNDKK